MKRPRPITKSHRVAADPGTAEALGIRFYDGYKDPFTREQCPTALYPNGTRIQKVGHEQADLTDVDALGTVLGSIGAPDVGVAYFVEWDTRPGRAVMIVERRIKRHV